MPKAGRPHIDPAIIEAAVVLVSERGMTIGDAAKLVGISRNTLSPFCRNVELRRWNQSRWSRRKLGENLVDVLASVVPQDIPSAIREEVIQQLVLEVLSSEPALAVLRARAVKLSRQLQPDRFRLRSLETPLANGLRLEDVLEG